MKSPARHDGPGLLAPEAPLEQMLSWAVGHAVHAPSELNAQPWSFRTVAPPDGSDAVVQLWLDETRPLPAVDPGAREAVVACGAALENLELALHGADAATTARLCPQPESPSLLAEVTLAGRAAEPEADRPLRLAILHRGSHRGPFDDDPVPLALVGQLVAAAAAGGAPIAVVTDDGRHDLVDLDDRGRALLVADPGYQSEVAAWSRTSSSDRRDGVPGYAYGMTMLQSWVAPLRARAGLTDEAQAFGLREAPLVLVVGSIDDGRESLLHSGRGLQRLLLTARAAGLAASVCNAALKVPLLRETLSRIVHLDHPQVLLRLGYAAPDRPVRRRATADVLALTPPVPPTASTEGAS